MRFVHALALAALTLLIGKPRLVHAASFVYTGAKTDVLQGEIDLDAPNDIRALLVMTNTTADTEQDDHFIGDIGTLDEMDGANYVRKALTGETVNQDDANNRAEFDAADVTWTALGAGARSIAGVVIFKFVTNDADSVLLAYIDTGGFPIAANGGDITITWNAEGIVQAT